MMMGCALFFDYVFACWPFRKLYLELPEYNVPQVRSGIGTYFRLEGRLRAHSYLTGRYSDELILALYRDDWSDKRRRLIALDFTPPRITGVRLAR
jgi:RimJ/RimL family protein N-acetyltransferase